MLARRIRSGPTNGSPMREGSERVGADTLSSDASVITLAPTRAPWFRSTDRIVPGLVGGDGLAEREVGREDPRALLEPRLVLREKPA